MRLVEIDDADFAKDLVKLLVRDGLTALPNRHQGEIDAIRQRAAQVEHADRPTMRQRIGQKRRDHQNLEPLRGGRVARAPFRDESNGPTGEGAVSRSERPQFRLRQHPEDESPLLWE